MFYIFMKECFVQVNSAHFYIIRKIRFEFFFIIAFEKFRLFIVYGHVLSREN